MKSVRPYISVQKGKRLIIAGVVLMVLSLFAEMILLNGLYSSVTKCGPYECHKDAVVQRAQKAEAVQHILSQGLVPVATVMVVGGGVMVMYSHKKHWLR